MSDLPELRDFVETALLDILKGISAAQGNSDFSRNIAPPSLANVGFASETGVVTSAGADVLMLCTTIRFDIQVAVESSSAADGKAGLKIGVVSLGGGISGTEKQASTQRLQFAVPITFPGPRPRPSQDSLG